MRTMALGLVDFYEYKQICCLLVGVHTYGQWHLTFFNNLRGKTSVIIPVRTLKSCNDRIVFIIFFNPKYLYRISTILLIGAQRRVIIV